MPVCLECAALHRGRPWHRETICVFGHLFSCWTVTIRLECEISMVIYFYPSQICYCYCCWCGWSSVEFWDWCHRSCCWVLSSCLSSQPPRITFGGTADSGNTKASTIVWLSRAQLFRNLSRLSFGHHPLVVVVHGCRLVDAAGTPTPWHRAPGA